MVDDRENLDPEDKKEDSFEFDSAGEVVEYISIAQARLLAMRASREEPGNYGADFQGTQMVFEVAGAEQDSQEEGGLFHIKLSYRPEGNFQGQPGIEEFILTDVGGMGIRQVLSWPVGEYVTSAVGSTPQPVESRSEPVRDGRDYIDVVFPDKVLEASVRKILKRPEGPISRGDLERLDFVSLGGAKIEDLTGLEYAVNLKTLRLTVDISDITPLALLTNLTELWLHNNQISDISPLASLTNLTELVLHNNQISDISPLASLTKLIALNIGKNQVSDISPLASLNNVTELMLTQNQISDISPLASLPNLTTIELTENQIIDISPLASLNNVTELALSDNQISDVSLLTSLNNLTELQVWSNPVKAGVFGLGRDVHLETLKSRGVKVKAALPMLNYDSFFVKHRK